jgi:hypothetical protein
VPPAGLLDLIASLVDKSLVIKEDFGGLACYRLHETMREFAGLKLADAGEKEAVEERCTEYYRSGRLLAALAGRYRLLEWLAWADLEIDNVRAVMQRCLARADAVRGEELAASLGWFWITRATTEGMRWLDAFLAFEHGARTSARAWVYFMRGFLAVLKAEPAAAGPSLRLCGSCSASPPQGMLARKVPAPRMVPGRGCPPSGRPTSRGWSPRA